jgi:ubiquinone/menaquinone biosynthesis C-methylase UbiE
MDGIEDGTFSHVLSTFMIQFLPNGQGVVEEMCRILQPGGVLGLGIWDKETDLLVSWAKACRAVDPGYEVPKSHDVDAWYSVPEMEDALKKAGLKDVQSDVVRVKFEYGKNTTEELVEFWFEGENPSAVWLINALKKSIEEGEFRGTIQDVRAALGKIIRDEYDDGQGLFLSMSLAAGRK